MLRCVVVGVVALGWHRPALASESCSLRDGADPAMKAFCDGAYPDCALSFAAYCDPPAGKNPWYEGGYKCQPIKGKEEFAAYCLSGACPGDYCEDVTPPEPATKAPATSTEKTTTKNSDDPRTTKKKDSTTKKSADETEACYKAPGWFYEDCADACIKDSSASEEDCTEANNDWKRTYFGTLDGCMEYMKANSICTGGGGGGGSSCHDKDECSVGTAPDSRPSFKGPNCYDSTYGDKFGEDWKPSGKTSVEKYLTPAMLINMSDMGTPGQTPSFGMGEWKTSPGSCEAAAAVFDNLVCAIEILMEKEDKDGVKFDLDGSIGDFANTGDEFTDKLELAGFISHKFKETARLTTWLEGGNNPYAEENEDYPPVEGKSYRGRGPVQISYNFNYGPFSEWFFEDKNILLQDPDKVDPEGPMGFIAAFWFWFTRRQFTSGAPLEGTIRARDAIIYWKEPGMNEIYEKEGDDTDYDAVAGLGLSTNVINGGIECNTESGEWRNWRVGYFLTAASRMGLDLPAIPGEGDFTDASKCHEDRFCRGFFAGCVPEDMKDEGFVPCSHEDSDCGAAYVDGWTNNLCH